MRLFELNQLAVVPEPVNVMVLLTQTALGPVMVGIGFTDMLFVFEHPVLVTYVIVAFPTEIPETWPVALTVATARLLEVQLAAVPDPFS